QLHFVQTAADASAASGDGMSYTDQFGVRVAYTIDAQGNLQIACSMPESSGAESSGAESSDADSSSAHGGARWQFDLSLAAELLQGLNLEAQAGTPLHIDRPAIPHPSPDSRIAALAPLTQLA